VAGYSAEAAWFHLAFPDILGLRRRCMRHGWNSNQQQMCIAFWMVMRIVFIPGHRHGPIVSSECLLRTQLFRSASLRPFRKRSRTYTKNNASGCFCQGRTQHHHSPCSVVCHCFDDLDRTSECPCTAHGEETSSFSSVRYQKADSSLIRHSLRLCPSCVL